MDLTDDILVGFPMKPDKGRLSGKVFPTTETYRPTINLGERMIRVALMTGFVIVLAIEAWLLLEALQIWM